MIARRLFLLLSVSCDQAARLDDACEETYSHICSYQVSCSLTPGQETCEREIREEFICNPDATLAQFRACERAALIDIDCQGTIPDVCGDVLCSRELGCVPEGSGVTLCNADNPTRPDSCDDTGAATGYP